MTKQQEQQVAWGDDGWASECGWTQVHCADPVTGEYLGQHDVWVTVGTGLPAGAYLNEPIASKDGFVVIREDNKWTYARDYRGQTVYNTDTKQQQVIDKIGPLPSGVTTLVPSSPYDVWDGKAWQYNDAAEQAAVLAKAKAEQNRRLSVAAQQIAIIKPAVEGGYAKPEHTKLLADWQRYRYELTDVPGLDGWPASPAWPQEPATIG
ncbi:MAG: tail fiber assembly protein [Plesiomonas shigelloides]